MIQQTHQMRPRVSSSSFFYVATTQPEKSNILSTYMMHLRFTLLFKRTTYLHHTCSYVMCRGEKKILMKKFFTFTSKVAYMSHIKDDAYMHVVTYRNVCASHPLFSCAQGRIFFSSLDITDMCK